MKLWRCMNDDCDEKGFEFEAPGNQCPHCKLFRAIELEPVHYLVPAEGPIRTALGNRMVACDQKMKKLPRAASGERSAVTCPKCKAGAVFQEDERDAVCNDVPLIEQHLGKAK